MLKKMNDSLGDRMKLYENAYRQTLLPRMPIIIRIDGRAFHTWTKGLERPFCDIFHNIMCKTAFELIQQISGAELAYTQSDEISILVHYYKRFNSESWFANNIQKIVSVSASIATAIFNEHITHRSLATFDSRCFLLPENEVCNYFIWRQRDCVRNSILSYANHLCGHKECQNKNISELQELCFQKGFNWNDVVPHFKRGSAIYKEDSLIKINKEIPTFSQDRDFIEKHLWVIDK